MAETLVFGKNIGHSSVIVAETMTLREKLKTSNHCWSLSNYSGMRL
jgi:hypothetical protein